jgi:hypothetical protein
VCICIQKAKEKKNKRLLYKDKQIEREREKKITSLLFSNKKNIVLFMNNKTTVIEKLYKQLNHDHLDT